MINNFKINSKVSIGYDNPCFIIAEAGVNHDGIVRPNLTCSSVSPVNPNSSGVETMGRIRLIQGHSNAWSAVNPVVLMLLANVVSSSVKTVGITP